MAGALGVGFQPAGNIRVTERFLDAQADGLGREETLLGEHGLPVWVAALLSGGRHQAEQRSPVHRPAPR